MKGLMERRAAHRMICEMMGTFKKASGENQVVLEETTIRDISETGIRFRLNQFIPIHDCSSMRLRLSPSTAKYLEVAVKPAWIRVLPNVEQYELGASFISLSKEDRLQLRDALALKSPTRR